MRRAKYVPLENLCLSPQCGFSSTHHGNRLTEDEQWRKLERVVEVAEGGMEMSREKEILGLEDKRFAAMVARDFAALEKLMHGELLYTHSSGVTDTKASWLESMKSGKSEVQERDCSERQVRFFGEVALVRGRAAIEVEISGQPKSLQLLFLNAWTRTPQGWKFAAWQSCPQPTA